MSENKKNIIGEVSVEVKAGLSVDEKTFRTCMNLAAIYANNKGLKGMVVFFNENDINGYIISPIETEEQCERILEAKIDKKKEEK